MKKIHVKNILKEMAKIYVGLKHQNRFKNQPVFLIGFDKRDEDDQVLDGNELYIRSNINQNSTESEVDNFDVRCLLEQQNHNQETKDIGWRFD